MMNWIRCALRVLGAISTAIPLLLAPLQAQEAPLLERGATVRFASQALDRHSSTGTPSGRSDRATSVAYARGKAVTAMVLSSDADTVYVRLSTGGQVAVPWESLEWMEKRSNSRRRTIVISTAIGAAAVGVPLAILGASVWEEDEPINQVVCAWGYPGCKGKNRWQSPAE